MLVVLIKDRSIYKLILPQNIDGNYWIRDSELNNNFINIEAKDGKWQIVNSNIQILSVESYVNKNYKKIIRNAVLEEYTTYVVYFKDSKKISFLYCLPVCDDKLYYFNIKNKNKITIGKNFENDIIYNNPLIPSSHTQILLNKNRWVIQSLDARHPTFVNNKVVPTNGQYLHNGDVIFIMGLTIIIVGTNVFVTNPKNKVKYKRRFCKSKIKKNVKMETSKKIKTKKNKQENVFKLPRVPSIIQEEEITITSPPGKQEETDEPLILTLGPSILMGVVALTSFLNTISRISSGNANVLQIISSVATVLSMLLGSILFPIIRKRYNAKKLKKQESKRISKYTAYLQAKQNTINDIMNKNKNILLENYPSSQECIELVNQCSSKLLEKRINDYDFLKIRFGMGDIPSNVKIKYSEPEFSMEDGDELDDLIHEIINNSKYQTAPVVLSLIENNILSIISQKMNNIHLLLKNMILQLFTLHNCSNLKIILFLENNIEQYDYLKTLPHVWNDEKEVRFFAYNDDNIKEISHYLEEELDNRIDSISNQKEFDYKAFPTHYVIITDCYKKIKNLKVIKAIVDFETNIGFSLICANQNLECVPSNSKAIINMENDKEATIYINSTTSIQEQKVNLELENNIYFEKICKVIANLKVEYSGNSKHENLLPNTYTFLEMFNTGLIEQLNVLNRWKKNDSTLSLKTPLGIDEMRVPIYLDIHEKFHGPHGLVAGSTGSGKSELIMTYILSLAINYHPDDVNFVLIDYKGGGLAGAFEKKNVRLPHLVGTITNINTNELQRSLISIESEVKRRQVLFNEVREITDEGTIDIYKYQRLYHEGKIQTPLAHLLIICDEFAELKQQQPDFMDELISISRIGRSLGVHLILATQKPAGIVNEQIRSNSKFAICLKVQTTADSTDVIKRSDAARLKKAGQFYLQVGNDEYFILGQSGWAGAPYYPQEKAKDDKVDDSIKFIDNIGNVIKEVNEEVDTQTVKSKGEQITNIVNYLADLSEQQNIKVRNLWLDNIGANIFLQDIKNKYNYKSQNNVVAPIVGEYDDPYNQKQDLVELNFLEKGNVAIYGNAESGKETFLSTLIFDLILTHSPNEVNLYLFDFGSESLKIFKDSKIVGDVMLSGDAEKIMRFFGMIQGFLNQRKNLLSDYNGDYKLYLEKSDKPLPMIIVILNNLDGFNELYNKNFQFDDTLLALTREGIQYGIVFIVTANGSGSMKYRLSQNFKEKIVLQLNKDSDYIDIIEKLGKKRPASIFGRGLVRIGDNSICEFQTAKICASEEFYDCIKENISKRNELFDVRARGVPVLPARVPFDMIKDYIKSLEAIPIGISKKDLNLAVYNFKKNFTNLMLSKNIKDIVEFMKYITMELSQIKDLNVVTFNAEISQPDGIEKVANDYKEFFEKIEENKDKDTVIIIIGVSKLVKAIDPNGAQFKATLENAIKLKKWNYILADCAAKIKELEYSDWYKTYVLKENGIWVGDGVESQYSITANFNSERPVKNAGRTFGYVITKEKPTFVKLIEMGEETDE